jgi:hypothetical protein
MDNVGVESGTVIRKIINKWGLGTAKLHTG